MSAQSDPNIPRSVKAAVRKAKLSTICQFLSTMERPLGMSDEEYRQFICQVMDYYAVDGWLYRKGCDGSAQLIPDPRDRLHLIQYAHDSLSHKGVFPTARNLLVCFWWPHLNEDVRWYVKTCHKCQVRQTEYFYILRVIPDVPSLF